MRTTWLTIDNRRVAVHESPGNGPPALLIHGHWDAGVAFRNQLEGPLGKEYRLVAIDLPGEGRSEPPVDCAATYSMPGFASVVKRVAEQMDLLSAVFVGWSLGGHILLEAAHDLPDARGFCIFGTPPLRFPPNLDEAFLPHPITALLFKEGLTEEEREAWADSIVSRESRPLDLCDCMMRADARRRPALLESISAVGYRDEVEVVQALRQPLAVFHAERDSVISLEYIQSLRMPSLFRGAVQVIPGASHAAQWEAPMAFDRALGDFLLEA